MNLLHCNKNCRHQKDGYCTMEGTQPIQQSYGDCPYFMDNKDIFPLSKQQLNCLRQSADSNKFNF